jgi:uncharacterized membrane protein
VTCLHRIEIAPHCSLSTRGAGWLIVSLAVPTFGVAGALTLLGFWPILPFAGLEMAVLAWALKVSLDRRHHHQIVQVDEARVSVTSRHREQSSEVVFPRHWAQVKLRRPVSGLHPSRLTIESHGRRCEVGSFLTEQERHGLATRLGRLIGPINESPTLV